jgi:predicted ArsR family transcriptional regulator
MNVLPLLREIVHAPVLDIILHLKHSTGMSVNELCQEMKMSYMGVKQHCVDLEKKRLLDTWRRPKPAGRPEKVYRLTAKLDPLFPEMGNDWTLSLLETADQVFGERAAAKLLFSYFQKRTERWQRSLRGAMTLWCRSLNFP